MFSAARALAREAAREASSCTDNFDACFPFVLIFYKIIIVRLVSAMKRLKGIYAVNKKVVAGAYSIYVQLQA